MTLVRNSRIVLLLNLVLVVKSESPPRNASLQLGNFTKTKEMNKHAHSVSIVLSRVSPTFSVRPRSSVGRVTVDLIRRSWVRFPPRSKDFFFASCGSLIPFTRANAQWVIHGLN